MEIRPADVVPSALDFRLGGHSLNGTKRSTKGLGALSIFFTVHKLYSGSLRIAEGGAAARLWRDLKNFPV
jgi:hypothetical protein